MKTTAEMIAVMQHYLNGGAVEMLDGGNWVYTPNALWDWVRFDYRIAPQYYSKSVPEKPKPALRPWRPNEVSMPMVIRPYNDVYRLYSAVMSMGDYVGIFGEHGNCRFCRLSLLVLSTDYEHSVDGCKTWWPCGVVEEVK